MARSLCLQSGVAGSGLLQAALTAPQCKAAPADLKASMSVPHSRRKADMLYSQRVKEFKFLRNADAKRDVRKGCITAVLANEESMFSGRLPDAESAPTAESSGRDASEISPADELLLQAGRAIKFAAAIEEESARQRKLERKLKRASERASYQVAAIASTLGFTALAGAAVYHRFLWQIPEGGAPPYAEMAGTFALAIGALVGMEYWARWAHKALWHASLWNLHESHHRPREGPFEANDIFAIINAAPAIALLAYGFFNKGFVPGLCFGAGLGITMFGMAYMFVHDGLVHRRFPVGPIGELPYLQKVAAAHQLHHADKYEGVPYGLFLGPEELERVGGREDLEALVQKQRSSTLASK